MKIKKKVHKSTNSTKKRKELFIKAYVSTIGNISLSCIKAKISRNVYYQWIEKDKLFKEGLKEELDKINSLVEGRLYNFAMFGDAKNSSTFNAMKLILAKHKDYSDKVDNKVEHKGEGFKLIIEKDDGIKKRTN